jgi:hypothetical protein
MTMIAGEAEAHSIIKTPPFPGHMETEYIVKLLRNERLGLWGGRLR